MPELPEVERAARILRAAIDGKTIRHVKALHPALARRVSARQLRALAGAKVSGVERRGKHQFIVLDDGRRVHVHFRMTGDWAVDSVHDPLPRFARAVIELSDGTRVVLDDPRALSTIDIHAARSSPRLDLGPEPSDKAFTAEALKTALTRRRGPIKPVLLDQRVIAGLGNIYAAESLWRARISPTAPANLLDERRLVTLIAAIRAVIDRATGARYRAASADRFDVYDREARPCRRCRTPVRRITQAGRSTYFCPKCQAR
jgi:formamidopyrimidine-DNA glycosylase